MLLTPSDITKIAEAFDIVFSHGFKQQLDIKDFYGVLKPLDISLNDHDIHILFQQIGTTGNRGHIVGNYQVQNFLVKRKIAYQNLYLRELFPKPFEVVPVDHPKNIVCVLFNPYELDSNTDVDQNISKEHKRAFKKGQYITVSSDGVINLWTDRFDRKQTMTLCKSSKKTLLSAAHKKMHVQDMVYVRNLKQVGIATSDSELLFCNCDCNSDVNSKVFGISYAIILDQTVMTMNYWSNETKAVFSIGDRDGYIYLFISYAVQTNGLFCKDLFEKTSQQEYPSAHVSALLNGPPSHVCVKVHILEDSCSQIHYFPLLDKFVTLGDSSRVMVLTLFNTTNVTAVSKRFESVGHKRCFLSAEHASSCGYIVTGGRDALMRLWLPHRNLNCVRTLEGHVKPINYIRFNHKDRIVLSMSEDMNVRVWTESWQCIQSLQVTGMESAPMASVFYNILNNELILTNSDIRKCLGRGTDYYQSILTSHDMPLVSVLYHNRYKQVVSVGQKAKVTVWDFYTGRALMQFDAAPLRYVSITALSFDEPQERLVSIAWDRIVRLWNFNSGTEVAALSVTVPNEVTAIVCTKKRIFVSTKKSKIIYDMDLVGDNNRLLEHPYLSDISSMDKHENTLITASTNRKVVVWDASSGETLYWLDTRESVTTHLTFKKDQGKIRSIPAKEKHSGGVVYTARINPPVRHCSPAGANTRVEITHLVTCLRARENTCTTATLLTSADGYIYAWSAKSKGGLLGKFKAVHDEDAAIVVMSPNSSATTLVTADSTGKICLWDIREFGFKKEADEGPFEDVNGWQVSLYEPPLLGSWQSHQKGIVNVVCDPTAQHIITAGLDNNVVLWTNTGCCRGVFGRNEWDVTKPCGDPPETNVEQEQT